MRALGHQPRSAPPNGRIAPLPGFFNALRFHPLSCREAPALQSEKPLSWMRIAGASADFRGAGPALALVRDMCASNLTMVTIRLLPVACLVRPIWAGRTADGMAEGLSRTRAYPTGRRRA